MKTRALIYRYLITTDHFEPFITHWFDADNHFNKEAGMIVFDLHNSQYTIDGKTWHAINEDHL